jgi:hypothetical protein
VGGIFDSTPKKKWGIIKKWCERKIEGPFYRKYGDEVFMEVILYEP